MTSTICIPVKSKCNVKFFFPESLVPCLQLKNNLRVNKISLFLYLNRHVSLYKIHEKNSHKTVYIIIIVKKCYLIKSYWYFISIHFIDIVHYFEVQNINCCLCWWHCSYFRFWKAWICNAKNNLNLSKLKEFWAIKRYSLAPVPLGIGLGLSSSLFHILRSLFIQQVCGSVEICPNNRWLFERKIVASCKVCKRNGWALNGHLIIPNQFQKCLNSALLIFLVHQN